MDRGFFLRVFKVSGAGRNGWDTGIYTLIGRRDARSDGRKIKCGLASEFS